MNLFFWRKPKALKPSEIVCYPDVMIFRVSFLGGKDLHRTTDCPIAKRKFEAVLEWLDSGDDTSFILTYDNGADILCRSNITWASIKTESRD